jgi:hypothetical protein
MGALASLGNAPKKSRRLQGKRRFPAYGGEPAKGSGRFARGARSARQSAICLLSIERRYIKPNMPNSATSTLPRPCIK